MASGDGVDWNRAALWGTMYRTKAQKSRNGRARAGEAQRPKEPQALARSAVLDAAMMVMQAIDEGAVEVRSMPDDGGSAQWGVSRKVARMGSASGEGRRATLTEVSSAGTLERAGEEKSEAHSCSVVAVPCVAASRAGQPACWPSNAAADWLRHNGWLGIPPSQRPIKSTTILLARRGKTRCARNSANVSPLTLALALALTPVFLRLIPHPAHSGYATTSHLRPLRESHLRDPRKRKWPKLHPHSIHWQRSVQAITSKNTSDARLRARNIASCSIEKHAASPPRLSS